MSLFKKKPKKVPLREKNPPKVLKVFKDYRLVVQEIPKYKYGTNTQIDCIQQLVLEQKNTNAMSEPYYSTLLTDGECRGFEHHLSEIERIKNQANEFMFTLLKEIYLNDKA